jgi:hypothetical protein
VGHLETGDRYFFSISYRESGLLLGPGPVATRRQLLAAAVRENRLERILHLLPGSSLSRGTHWITRNCSEVPGHFWKLIGLAPGPGCIDGYRGTGTRLAVLRHLLAQNGYSFWAYSNVICYGVKKFVSELFLQPVFDELIALARVKRVPDTADRWKPLFCCLVRYGRTYLLGEFAKRFGAVARPTLNAAMRIAGEVNMVPEVSEILLKFYGS